MVGRLFKRIIDRGVCELLYFQTRYANGESVGLVEFAIGDMILPITFVGDYVVIRTVMFQDGGTTREKFTRIELGDK